MSTLNEECCQGKCDPAGSIILVDDVTELGVAAPDSDTTASLTASGHLLGRTARRESTKTVGLCMIVKDESGVILRCLESVRSIADYVLVEDTGSTDGIPLSRRSS